MRIIAGACALVALTTLTVHAEAARIKHDMQIEMERRSGGFISTVGFTDGADGTDVPLEAAGGGVTNPLFKDNKLSGQNPIYNGGDRAGSPGDFATISSIALEFDEVSFLHDQGVVHRDVAARTVVIASDLGWYALPDGATALFSSDGVPDYSAAPTVWVLTADVTAFLHGDPANIDDAWVLRAGSTITATPVPAPGAALALGAAGLVGGVRRHRRD